MKHIKYLILLAIGSNSLFSFSNKSFLAYRSQGFNLARNNSGWLKRCAQSNGSMTIEYSRSFDEQALNNYYFGCNELVFSGSRVEDRGSNDILADYFGLPTDFKSTLSFSPQIKNIIVDFDFYWLLGCNDSGFNLRVNVPFAHTQWELNPCEKVIDKGSLDYPAGYMSASIITQPQLKKGALSVLADGETFGDLSLPLQYGRISRCKQSLNKFSDVLVALGYDIVCEPQGMLALDAHVVIPTGTRSQAVNLFEPQVGNGHHWALGGSVAARYDLITSEANDFTLSACFDAYVQHLFKATQKRSYDLINNGPGSRYMLVMDMIRNISITQGFSPTPGVDLLDRQYITRLLYAVDATTLDSTIKVNVQADIVAKLSATYGNWNFEVGYNFWVRSKEDLVCREQLQHKFYGLKGDAQVYGFLDVGIAAIPLPLNATQSEATLRAVQPDGNTTDNFVNNNANNPALMYNFGQPVAQTTAASLSNTGATVLEQVNGSNQAIVLSDADINECSGLSARALSHKVFGALRYEFDGSRVKPYLLLGAEGEFAGETDCVKTAVSQWGVWVKGGVNY